VAELRAESLEAALEQLGIRGVEFRRVSPNWAENVVRFLTHPVLSSLLVTIGLLGIIIELRTPGFGIAGAIGVGSLAAFFWGHWLVQLAAGASSCSQWAASRSSFSSSSSSRAPASPASSASSPSRRRGHERGGPGATPEFLMLAAGRIVVALLVALVASFGSKASRPVRAPATPASLRPGGDPHG
jgi:hypothetical protein